MPISWKLCSKNLKKCYIFFPHFLMNNFSSYNSHQSCQTQIKKLQSHLISHHIAQRHKYRISLHKTTLVPLTAKNQASTTNSFFFGISSIYYQKNQSDVGLILNVVRFSKSVLCMAKSCASWVRNVHIVP